MSRLPQSLLCIRIPLSTIPHETKRDPWTPHRQCLAYYTFPRTAEYHGPVATATTNISSSSSGLSVRFKRPRQGESTHIAVVESSRTPPYPSPVYSHRRHIDVPSTALLCLSSLAVVTDQGKATHVESGRRTTLNTVLDLRPASQLSEIRTRLCAHLPEASHIVKRRKVLALGGKYDTKQYPNIQGQFRSDSPEPHVCVNNLLETVCTALPPSRGCVVEDSK